MEPCYLHMGGRLQVFRGHPPNPRTHQYWAQLDTQPIEWWNRSSSGNKAVGKPGPSIPPDTFFPSERIMGCFVNSPLCSIPIPVRFHSWWISFFFSLFRRHARRFSGTNLVVICPADLGWTDDTDAPRPRVFTAKAIEAARSHESQLSGRTAWTPWSKIEKKLLSQLIELNPPTARARASASSF